MAPIGSKWAPQSWSDAAWASNTWDTVTVQSGGSSGFSRHPQIVRRQVIRALVRWHFPAFTGEIIARVSAPTVTASIDGRWLSPREGSGQAMILVPVTKAVMTSALPMLEMRAHFGTTERVAARTTVTATITMELPRPEMRAHFAVTVLKPEKD